MPSAKESLRPLRDEVRSFLETWVGERGYSPRCDSWLRGYDREFTKEMASRGWLGLTWPKRFGGGGRTNLERLVITEELLRAGAPVAAHWIGDRQIGPALLRHGSEQLQDEFLPRLASGEITFCLGMSEPEAGSDLAAIRTRATEIDAGWRIDGTKIWTSHAHRSDYAYVLARTSNEENRHDGLTEFIVDLSAPGISIRPIIDLSNEHHFNELQLDGVTVPKHRVIGRVGNGWEQVIEQLSYERGGPERVLTTYPLLEAVAGNVAENPGPASLECLGVLTAQLATLLQMVRETAVALDAGEAPIRQAALTKFLGTEFEYQVVEAARSTLPVQPHGDGSPLEHLLADGIVSAPGVTLRGGSTEILFGVVNRTSGTSSGKDETDLLREVVGESLLSLSGTNKSARGWTTAVELGWLDIDPLVDIEGLHHAAVVCEQLGHHAVSMPFEETVVARSLLRDFDTKGDVVGHGPLTLQAISDGGNFQQEISGSMGRVPWARDAEALLLVHSDGVAVVDRDQSGYCVQLGENLAGEPRDRVELDNAVVRLWSRYGGDAWVRLRLLRSARILGALRAVHDLSVRYTAQREQFGRPLSRFQLVGAHLAHMAGHVDIARKAVDSALAAEDEDVRELRTSMVETLLEPAITEVTRRAHQVHGAMGITHEYPLHRFTMRLWAWRAEVAGKQAAQAVGRACVELGGDPWRLVPDVIEE